MNGQIKITPITDWVDIEVPTNFELECDSWAEIKQYQKAFRVLGLDYSYEEIGDETLVAKFTLRRGRRL